MDQLGENIFIDLVLILRYPVPRVSIFENNFNEKLRNMITTRIIFKSNNFQDDTTPSKTQLANRGDFFYQKSTIGTTIAVIGANNGTYCLQTE